jgi:hypothetical protein
MLASVLVALVVGACSSPGSSPPGEQQQQPIPSLEGKDPTEAAQKSLDAYKKLVGPDDFGALGFKSLDEVQQAELGPSLAIKLVPLDRLAQFDRGANPEDLLTDAGRVVFEVRVAGELRTSLEVGQVGDLWQGQSFGEPALIAALAPLRRTDQDFEVLVPALNVYFVATRDGDQLELTPAFDYPTFDLANGKTLPAGDALALLVPAAKGHDGLPN